MRRTTYYVIGAVALAAAACGDDDGPDAAGGRCGDGTPFALSTHIDSAEGTTSDVLLTPDVAAPAELDTAGALEAAGGVVVSSSPMTFELGGAWYANESAADDARTTLVRTDAAAPTAGVSFPGGTDAIAQVR